MFCTVLLVLYCSILFYCVQYCSAMFYTVLLCSTLFYYGLYYSILFNYVLYSSIQFYIFLFRWRKPPLMKFWFELILTNSETKMIDQISLSCNQFLQNCVFWLILLQFHIKLPMEWKNSSWNSCFFYKFHTIEPFIAYWKMLHKKADSNNYHEI